MSQSHVKFLNQAQKLLEEMRVDFENQFFTRTFEGISVTVKGTMEMTNVSGAETVSVDTLMRAYMETLHIVKYARSIGIIQVRNKILKSRFDILPIMPEVRDALTFVSNTEKPDSYSPD